MDDVIIKIADKLLSLAPLIRKKISVKTKNEKRIINHTHYMIMINLRNEGKMSVSEIGRRLAISKPNMTPLIDRLIKVGFVKRMPDEHDRRIVNIVLTEKGIEYMTTRRKENLNRLESKLRVLPDDEIKRLADALDVLYHH